MHYWLVVARLFELAKLPEYQEGGGTTPPQPSDPNPTAHVMQAKTCLQTLLRLYYTSHGCEGYDFFIILLSAFIGFTALIDMSAADGSATLEQVQVQESTTILCARILYGQGDMTYLATVVFRVMQESLPVSICSKLPRYVNIMDVDEEQTKRSARQVQIEWPVDVKLIESNINDRQLGNLYRAIAELSVDDGSSTVNSTSRGSSPAVS